ncbi:hypothetical protein PABG_03992 [Paracoccidioides brasiliensis Pb03]|nr:hypothetical protein PABG_03992 [Paracoccidioides brasiliensis Pb03]
MACHDEVQNPALISVPKVEKVDEMSVTIGERGSAWQSDNRVANPSTRKWTFEIGAADRKLLRKFVSHTHLNTVSLANRPPFAPYPLRRNSEVRATSQPVTSAALDISVQVPSICCARLGHQSHQQMENLQRYARKSECQIEHGPQTETIYQTSPPPNTLAVVVDISNTGGALKVHQKSDNSWGNIFIGMVGSGDDDENIRNLVIVPWDAGWHYRTIGNIKIKYIIKK